MRKLTHVPLCRSSARVSLLLSALVERSPGAKAQAETWQDAAARWLSGMRVRFAAYRDVLQPLALAVYELKLGLALTAASADAGASEPVAALPAALRALLSFPAVPDAATTLASLAVQAEAVAQLTVPVAAAADPDSLFSMMDTGEQAGAAAEELSVSACAADELQILLLRSALAACGGTPQLSGVTTHESWGVLRGLFAHAAALWASERAAIAEADAESLSEFRTATRSVAAAVAELAAADVEAAYRARFESSAFQDLEPPAADEQLSTAELAQKASVAAALAAAVKKPTRSAVFGAALLEDLLCVHWAATSANLQQSDGSASSVDWHAGIGPTQFAPHGSSTWAAALAGSRETFGTADVWRCARAAVCSSLGMRLLRAAGGVRGDVLHDADVLGGSALHVALEHIRLARGISAGARVPSASGVRSDCSFSASLPEDYNTVQD